MISRKISSFRLQYISDIHLENKHTIPYIPSKSKYLALLGDIGYPHKHLYNTFLKYCSMNWDQVLLISGNHEYDKYSINDVDNMILDQVSKFNNITYLNNKQKVLDKYLILGTTLWSNNNHLDNNNKINVLYNESINWLEDNIKNNLDKDIIVLSHHLPSHQMISQKYKTCKSKYNFSTNLDYLIKPPIKAWLCGHSHCQLEKYINNVYCGINSLGNNKITNLNTVRILEL